MAFDGITIAAMVKELHLNLDGGRFDYGEGGEWAVQVAAFGQCFSSADLFYF